MPPDLQVAGELAAPAHEAGPPGPDPVGAQKRAVYISWKLVCLCVMVTGG